MAIKVDYKARFGFESGKSLTPASIVRKMVGDGVYVIESCNKDRGWRPNPDLISMWIGAPDGGYSSPPEGDTVSSDFAEKWINKLENNWN